VGGEGEEVGEEGDKEGGAHEGLLCVSGWECDRGRSEGMQWGGERGFVPRRR
jgi:hypothetical protein